MQWKADKETWYSPRPSWFKKVVTTSTWTLQTSERPYLPRMVSSKMKKRRISDTSSTNALAKISLINVEAKWVHLTRRALDNNNKTYQKVNSRTYRMKLLQQTQSSRRMEISVVDHMRPQELVDQTHRFHFMNTRRNSLMMMNFTTWLKSPRISRSWNITIYYKRVLKYFSTKQQ